jgi:hypothetical protein
MKFKLLGLSAIIVSSLVLNANDISEDKLQSAYMMGAFHSLEQLSRNFKVQGMNKDKIEFNKYMVALDIQNMPTYKLMIYQQIGYQESLTPVVVNDKYLVFGSYDRKADAVYLQEKVLNSFHFKNKDEKTILIENENSSWYKSQFVQKELFDTLIAEANKNVKAKVFVVEESNEELEKRLNLLEENNKKEGVPSIPPSNRAMATVQKVDNTVYKNKAPIKKEVITTKFKLKYKTQIFKYAGNWNDNILFDKKISPSYMSKGIESRDYRFVTTKKTKNGFEYIKLYDYNLWVNKNDIEIIN